MKYRQYLRASKKKENADRLREILNYEVLIDGKLETLIRSNVLKHKRGAIEEEKIQYVTLDLCFLKGTTLASGFATIGHVDRMTWHGGRTWDNRHENASRERRIAIQRGQRKR